MTDFVFVFLRLIIFVCVFFQNVFRFVCNALLFFGKDFFRTGLCVCLIIATKLRITTSHHHVCVMLCG